jgi:hypothetical protein
MQRAGIPQWEGKWLDVKGTFPLSFCSPAARFRMERESMQQKRPRRFKVGKALFAFFCLSLVILIASNIWKTPELIRRRSDEYICIRCGCTQLRIRESLLGTKPRGWSTEPRPTPLTVHLQDRFSCGHQYRPLRHYDFLLTINTWPALTRATTGHDAALIFSDSFGDFIGRTAQTNSETATFLLSFAISSARENPEIAKMLLGGQFERFTLVADKEIARMKLAAQGRSEPRLPL